MVDIVKRGKITYFNTAISYKVTGTPYVVVASYPEYHGGYSTVINIHDGEDEEIQRLPRQLSAVRAADNDGHRQFARDSDSRTSL